MNENSQVASQQSQNAPRVLKFRVWDDKNHKMIYKPKRFEIIKIYDNSDELLYRFDSCFWTKPEFIQQFTGLLDKNGKEIYEGDIVHIWGEDFEGNTGEHLFHQIGPVTISEYGPKVEYVDGKQYNAEVSGGCSCTLANYNVVFIIGNIFENPELLES